MKKIVLVISLFIININIIYARENVKFFDCVDGDTIKVLINSEEKTLRFLAIDTPESVHPKKKIEYYGKEASDYTCKLAKEATKLQIEYDDSSTKKDKYDRLLVWLFIDDKLLQDLLVINGYAKVAYLYGDYKYTSILVEHEKDAKEQSIGIWNEEAKIKFNPNSIANKETNEHSKLTLAEIILILSVGALLALFKKNKIYKIIKKMYK